MAISERQFLLGSLVSTVLLMLALSWSYRHTRHSWFFRPDVERLEVHPVVLCCRLVTPWRGPSLLTRTLSSRFRKAAREAHYAVLGNTWSAVTRSTTVVQQQGPPGGMRLRQTTICCRYRAPSAIESASHIWR